MTGTVLAMLALAGGAGQGFPGNRLTDFISRTKTERAAKAQTEDEIRTRIESELKARWEAGGSGGASAAWRMEMSQMLQHNGGVATTDVKQSLAQSLQA